MLSCSNIMLPRNGVRNKIGGLEDKVGCRLSCNICEFELLSIIRSGWQKKKKNGENKNCWKHIHQTASLLTRKDLGWAGNVDISYRCVTWRRMWRTSRSSKLSPSVPRPAPQLEFVLEINTQLKSAFLKNVSLAFFCRRFRCVCRCNGSWIDSCPSLHVWLRKYIFSMTYEWI